MAWQPDPKEKLRAGDHNQGPFRAGISWNELCTGGKTLPHQEECRFDLYQCVYHQPPWKAPDERVSQTTFFFFSFAVILYIGFLKLAVLVPPWNSRSQP